MTELPIIGLILAGLVAWFVLLDWLTAYLTRRAEYRRRIDQILDSFSDQITKEARGKK